MSFHPVFFATRPCFLLLEAVAALVVLITVVMVGPVKAEPALDQTMKTIFTVHTADAEDRFLGSAFLWGGGEVAVTNAHVVGEAREVRLTDAAGQVEIGRVIAMDPVRDVAVISVRPGRAGLVPLTDAPRLGAEVWALGAPLGADFSVTRGIISMLARQVDPTVPIRMIQHDAAVNPGSSGGPLVDSHGALLGMNAQIADGSRMFVGIAYAIPARDMARIVPGLIDKTLAPIPQLGLIARTIDRQLAQALAMQPGGVLVDSVKAGSLAFAAQVLPGDVVLAANGLPIRAAGDLAFALEAATVAGSTDLAIWRAGAMVAVSVDLLVRSVQETAATERVASYGMRDLGLTLRGSTVVAVAENSLALFAGVSAGDVIIGVNGRAAEGLADLQNTAPLLLLLQGEQGATRHVLINPWASGKAIRPVGGANVLDPAVVVF